MTWKIKNPNPPFTQRLQISKIQNSVTDTSEYIWDALIDSWTLSTGNGARVETRTVSYPTLNSRSETFTVKNSAGQVVSKVVKTYFTFPWGEELVQVINDPDAAALTTTYAYYENPVEESKYRKIQSVTFPDGSWGKYDYDSDWNKSLVLRSWKDVTLATRPGASGRRAFTARVLPANVRRLALPALL